MARCTAHKRGSDQRCGQSAIKGGSVCRFHGGSAPQVKQRAQERLMEMVDPVLPELKRISLEAKDETCRLAGIREILNRTLGKPTQKTEITGADGDPVKQELVIEFD